MTAVLLPWLKFVLCAALIGAAGPVLTRYGEIIASLTGLSRAWIGLVLLATVTSLPELFTGISAVTVADAPNIAVGDALGSCVFNLLMLVVLDALSSDQSVYHRIDQGHIVTAGFGVILIGSTGALLLLDQENVGPCISASITDHYHPLFRRDACRVRSTISVRQLWFQTSVKRRPRSRRPSFAIPLPPRLSFLPAFGCRSSGRRSQTRWAGGRHSSARSL